MKKSKNPSVNYTLEEILEIIFYRSAAVYGKHYSRIKHNEVREVVQLLAQTMRNMHLTILPDNLLK